ncbi:low-density lipoprotein receptor-related protein 5-like isoform X2 [Dreissena polymorpha]|uniref:low-density lipoprotein receptor-related protein 5-like isoform X2 n=1 Tax=Dreissena polymorpha TaxID=45954 RepID=UPI002264EED8|nr:low-density lipoprotein receptor-related protein 5-like isoform X2 [Dreissena polymorpha]
MWTVRIIVTVFAFYEVVVSDALSTGYLVLGSIVTGDVYENFLALPIEVVEGNTTINTTRRQSMFLNTKPMSIDVDYARKQLYIYNEYTASLEMLNFDPETGLQNLPLKSLHSGLSRGYVTIALDWISNNLYWTDPIFRWVAVQSLQTNGHYRILVYDNIERPTGIAVDPIHKYMFWSDVGSYAKIERSSLTGNGRKTIISPGKNAQPIALDVDIASSKLYWVDNLRDTVERSNLDGKERSTIRKEYLQDNAFFDIAVLRDVVYALELSSSTGGKVHLFNKDTGVSHAKSIESKYSGITCVTLFAPQPTITDYCSNIPCESICVSETTGPECLCREGFTLNADGRTCSETTGLLHRALVWATATTVCAADITGIHDELKYIATNKTCFPNLGSNLNWLTVGLAVDWGSKDVYWCQGKPGTGKIKVLSQTTTNMHTLISSGLNNPKALNVIPWQSKMIWIQGRSGSYQIKMAHMQGTYIQTIVDWKFLFEPRDLTVDATTELVYFIDGQDLRSVKLDGTQLTTIDGGASKSILPLKLHSYKNHLLVADSGVNLDVVSLMETSSNSYTLTTLVAVTDIGVFDITEQPKEKGACDADNGFCQHICIPLGRERICQCRFGYVLDDNKETCSSEPLSDNFMYVSDWYNDEIYQVSLINDAVNALDIKHIDSPTGVLYNSITKRIIWIQTSSTKIHSANANGTGYSEVFDVASAEPHRLALDYSTGDIFYTAEGSNTLPTKFTGIGVVSPNGIHRKVILEGVKPRAIAIEPVKGFLFWTDYGTSVLMRANTDGTNIVTLYTSLESPNGIAIDISASTLYVADGGTTNIIYRCGYEANTCVQYFKDTEVRLRDIQLLGNYLYYTAWNKVSITKLHKTNTNDTAQIANNAEFGRLNCISLHSSKFFQINVGVLKDPSPTSGIGDFTSNTDTYSSSKIMYIGAGVGGTIAIVIIVVVIVIVFIKCGRKKPQTSARYEENPQHAHANAALEQSSMFEGGAVTLRTHDEKPYSMPDNLGGVSHNSGRLTIDETIDPIKHCPTNDAPHPPTKWRKMPRNCELSDVYSTPSKERRSVLNSSDQC